MEMNAALILHGIDIDLTYRCLKTYLDPQTKFDKCVIPDYYSRTWRKGLESPYKTLVHEKDKKKVWNFHQILPAFLVMYKNYKNGKDIFYNFYEQVGEIPGFKYYENRLRGNRKYVEKKLEEFNLKQYNLVGLGCIDRTVFSFLVTLFYIKVNFPDTKLVVGGPWFNVNSEARKILVEETKLVDTYIHGDGEVSFPKWIENPDHYTYMDNQIKNLDTLPFHEISKQEVLWTKRDATFMYSTRGCSHDCTFCQQGLGRFRKVSSRLIAENIERTSKQGLNSFFFSDNVTGYSPNRIQNIYRELEKRKLIGSIDIQFMYVSPLVAANRKCLFLLKKMRAHIHTGVESFSPRILKLMGKPNDSDLNIKIGELFLKNYIDGDYGKIMGFPSETWDEFVYSKDLFLKYATKSDSKTMGLFVLYPKTDIYENPPRYGISFYYFPENVSNIYPDLGKYVKKIPMGYVDHNDPDDLVYNKKREHLFLLNRVRRTYAL
jgi:radical SAM superfamily enzyme YgiQ (UPF0313 family)